MQTDRKSFLILATLVQGGVATIALIVAWLLGINPFDNLVWTDRAVIMGICGTIPMLLLFAISWRATWPALKEIREFLIEALGPSLQACQWYDLVWVAALAGFSEEILFRGVIQSAMSPWGLPIALVLSNLLFGLAHAVTRLYVLLAALLGMYLGLLFHVSGGNVLAPILTHGLYDLVAFVVVQRAFEARLTNSPVAADSTDPGGG